LAVANSAAARDPALFPVPASAKAAWSVRPKKLKVAEIMGAVAREHGKVHTAVIRPESTSEAINLVRKLE